jgi:ATP-dependent Clp protease protease subunit
LDEETHHTIFTAFQRMLDDDQEKSIRFFINTPGGDETYMLSLYDLIITSPVKIKTVGIGEVSSAGVLLLAAGHERYVSENCVLMSHQGSYSLEGKYEDAKARMEWINWVEKRWAELMARHSGKDTSYWKRITKKEAELWILGGQAIVDAGLADVVITNTHEATISES